MFRGFESHPFRHLVFKAAKCIRVMNAAMEMYSSGDEAPLLRE